jgi:phosphatidate cytidylyltransferase
MLKERILTALVLIPLVLWCIFGAATSIPFEAFAGAIVIVGAWEWTALMRWSNMTARALDLQRCCIQPSGNESARVSVY